MIWADLQKNSVLKQYLTETGREQTLMVRELVYDKMVGGTRIINQYLVPAINSYESVRKWISDEK